MRTTSAVPLRLGLSANARQFWLLVAVNAFVGAMIGLERTVPPLIAEQEFNLTSSSLILSFVAAFGLVKAITNLFAGRLGDKYGRRPVLLAGWLLALPVPLMIMLAPSWSWIIAANLLLGASQGLTWSTTVIMKIDLVGPQGRGFAMGLNEAAGYLAVAASAYLTSVIAANYGLRPEPFYLGVAFAAAGLALTALFVRETLPYTRLEAAHYRVANAPAGATPSLLTLLREGVWRNRALASANQAGLVNNLNDGVAWGLLPVYFAAQGVPLVQVGLIAATYPAVWGFAQLLTGALSDSWGRKGLIVTGMLVQGVALLGIALLNGFVPWMLSAALLGVGTAMVYPTLLAAVADASYPTWRGTAVGAYRLWRDGGLAVGAILGGLLADALSIPAAVLIVAVLTAASGLLVAVRMPETLPRPVPSEVS
ncbi:MFS transporter [Deinococcus peraridilitoris]|uniref:Arabinose efflux permease family protein n=1 Tax=Deinococcus peraridilitoris (strain DSM 19664 / LMG 22246 / CIP 109416 / KR-200) TaxID=937777 RepID=L0A9J1_DEIPD|nr:MFS transporter [Deinococcus peraridilitoris]AFZ69715.1 arabinose efflux permease family protein [Deinococcus peraridilitoris DSM 19664]